MMTSNRGGVASTSNLSQRNVLQRQCCLRSTPRGKTRNLSERCTCSANKDQQAATRQWREYYRYVRYQKADHLPRVSWERYHLSVIFVDRSDTVRARVAAGIFDRIANWNGFGRALYPTTAGVDVTGEAPDITTSVGLMSQAGLLKIPPKLFSRPGQQFEVEDLDRNDIVVAIDSRTKARLEAILCEGVPDCKDTMAKVGLLTDFKSYVSSRTLLQTGGSALLEPELKQIIEPALAEVKGRSEIESPSLTEGSGEWNLMVQNIVYCAAGLVRFLIDAWPPDLPEYDPL